MRITLKDSLFNETLNYREFNFCIQKSSIDESLAVHLVRTPKLIEFRKTTNFSNRLFVLTETSTVLRHLTKLISGNAYVVHIRFLARWCDSREFFNNLRANSIFVNFSQLFRDSVLTYGMDDAKMNPASAQNCRFFVKRKKRFCRMTVKAGNSFCGEHLEAPTNEETIYGNNELKSKRISCPIDPTHTCYESRLTQHLKVCNAKRLADAQPAYIVKGINLGDVDGYHPIRVQLSEVSQSLIDSIIKKVEVAHERLPAINEGILCEEILRGEIENETYGDGVRKHLLQNASLLGHVKNAGLAQNNTCFIEFGAGKGKLTYWLAQTIKDLTGSSLMLIDRSSHRHKRDNKLKNEDCPLNISRIRADIADLRLSDVPEIRNTERIVGIAKHLCGAATDLTIRCLAGLMHDDPKSHIAGLIVAFCCHHRCEYSSYVGKNYLQSCGFTADDFPILCSIASWATCATGKNRDFVAQETEEKSRNIAEREDIGRKVKSLLNWGRIEYLNSLGFNSNLVYYTTPKVSLENMCMVSVLKSS